VRNTQPSPKLAVIDTKSAKMSNRISSNNIITTNETDGIQKQNADKILGKGKNLVSKLHVFCVVVVIFV